MKILFVGGTWSTQKAKDETYGKISEMAQNCIDWLRKGNQVTAYNGGNYSKLHEIIKTAPEFDAVFWWANVPNNLPKIRNVKEFAPTTMLINSKRNDQGKYSFMDLTQMALAAKANLTFEFVRNSDGQYHFMVFDPLGCAWYAGDDLKSALEAAVRRLEYLRQITRQSTIEAPEGAQLLLSWYFDRFKQTEYKSSEMYDVPNEVEFVRLVRTYAERFHEIMQPAKDVKRFLGNASLRTMPPQVGRCSKGMPSFRGDKCIFVSRRNVDKEYLTLDQFVPVYMEDGKLFYCGDAKPSVDAPIQLRLYDALPNINYMIHSHCYIDGAAFTTKSIPCGAIEEVEEVLETLKARYGTLEGEKYVINLFGHGSIAFGLRVEDLNGLNYVGRKMPEAMFWNER